MKHVFMKSFAQLDDQRFEIAWSDGGLTRLSLAQVQASCPCAQCSQFSGSKNPKPSVVKARLVESVGRYALRFEFDQGCRSGVYTYELLRSLHLEFSV